jgi:hypothetical protein
MCRLAAESAANKRRPSAGRPALASPCGGRLARREHSRAEIERKLQRRLCPRSAQDDLVQVLERLQARGLLSDRRMAEALVRTRHLATVVCALPRNSTDAAWTAKPSPPRFRRSTTKMPWPWRFGKRKFGRAPASHAGARSPDPVSRRPRLFRRYIGRVLSTPTNPARDPCSGPIWRRLIVAIGPAPAFGARGWLAPDQAWPGQAAGKIRASRPRNPCCYKIEDCAPPHVPTVASAKTPPLRR